LGCVEQIAQQGINGDVIGYTLPCQLVHGSTLLIYFPNYLIRDGPEWRNTPQAKVSKSGAQPGRGCPYRGAVSVSLENLKELIVKGEVWVYFDTSMDEAGEP
jgi:hypothetical protein